ncbi:hypothetical protein R1sor_001324 [Riccia sorocarpa]|uniref:Uncharacterized protein n=1 Tax=Riccia sorocarpa TaxID=122646 RepID=A0ABD3GYR2_9MARC
MIQARGVLRLAFPAEFRIHGVDPLPPEVSAADNTAASQSQALNNWATWPTLFHHRNQRRQEKNQTPMETSQKQLILPSETEHPPAHVNTEEQVIRQVAQVESRRLVHLARSKSKRPFDDFSTLQGLSNSSFTNLVLAHGVPRQIQDQEISPLAKRLKPFTVSEAALAEEEAELAAETGETHISIQRIRFLVSTISTEYSVIGADSVGASGGIAFLVHQSVMIEEGQDVSSKFIWRSFRLNGGLFHVVGIHGPNDAPDRILFWEQVMETLPDVPFMLVVDFNNVEVAADSSSRMNRMSPDEMTAFLRLCGAFNLFDVRMLARQKIGPR